MSSLFSRTLAKFSIFWRKGITPNILCANLNEGQMKLLRATKLSIMERPKSCRQCHLPAHPGKQCMKPKTNDNINSSSTSSDEIFPQTNFPSINKLQQSSSPSKHINMTKNELTSKTICRARQLSIVWLQINEGDLSEM